MKPLVSQIQKLRLPLKSDLKKSFKSIDLFRGSSSNIGYMHCHASVLKKGLPPHLPHKHAEEELLVLLQGEADVIISETDLPEKLTRHRLQTGQCAYYPAGYQHTIETISEKPASYVMFKWHGSASGAKSPQKFNIYTLFNKPHVSVKPNPVNIRIKLVFEGSTSFLKRLHCHTTELLPSASYKAHSDRYDIAIIVLQGKLETLSQKVNPFDVIFYKNGDLHGMSNIGKEPAFYAVLEFHGEKSRLWPGFQNLKRIILSIMNDPESIKPRLKNFINRLCKFR